MITIDIRKSNKCNEEYSAFVSFPYDNTIVNTIRSLSTRYWNNDSKEWEIPTKKIEVLVSKLQDFDFTIKGHYLEDEKEVEVDKLVPYNFEFKTKPFEHQIEGFEYGLKYDKWLLGDEQGLGKTKQVIDIAVAKKLANGYKHCLIICGVNGLKWNWYNEVHTHSNEGARILGQKKRKNGNIVVGSSKDKLNDLKNINTIDEYFLITNVETLRDSDIVDELKKLCKDGTIGIIALDEAHKCKNPSSQQGKGLLKLNAKTMIAMTGTPLMNTPLDLYIILKWLGYEKHAMYSFKNHYCVMGGYGGYEILGYKNLDELQERLNEIMLRRLKKDVLDLPEKTLVNEYVEMTPKQSVIYKEVTAEVKSNIDMIKTSPNPLAQLIRMRQATGYTGILSSSVLESAKLDRLEEIVDEAIENGQKVVVFSNWTQMTTPAYERLAKKYSGAIITGEISTEERAKSVERFQNDDNCKFIVGTIGAMGTGLNLFEGSVIIFLDHPWTRAMYDQAVDRCHRIGQKNKLTVYNLLCKDTIDERIWEIVTKKGAMSDALIDGQSNVSEIVDYLLS